MSQGTAGAAAEPIDSKAFRHQPRAFAESSSAISIRRATAGAAPGPISASVATAFLLQSAEGRLAGHDFDKLGDGGSRIWSEGAQDIHRAMLRGDVAPFEDPQVEQLGCGLDEQVA